MKKIMAIVLSFMLLLSLSGCGNQSVGEDNETVDTISEGLFLPCADGNYIAIFDNYGPVILHPESEDTSVFDELTVGDRIQVKHGMLLETYPASTVITKIEKISDGSRNDIPDDVVEDLIELGRQIWTEDSTNNSQGNIETDIVEESTFLEETQDEWTFLEGEGGWHQRVTDEHLANAKYIFDQGIDSALEAHCVLLYKDDARDFALYYSFKSYQYDDYEEVLIVSNGKRTVAKGNGDWTREDLRETASAYDLDLDGFEEIIIPVVTGIGTGYFHTSFFIFDSSDGIAYDKLSVCGAEDIVYCVENYETKYLQDVSVTVDKKDGTVIFKQGENVKYLGHIKGLIASYPDISKVRWSDSVSAELKEDGKLTLNASPCFWGDNYVIGEYVEPYDTENDVCDIIYEIEYLSDGSFSCTLVRFE